MESRPGEIVRSLAGHDTGEYYMVIKADGDLLTLTNGKNKNLQHTKQKKQKHVQVVRGVEPEIAAKLEAGRLTDADVIHLLRVGKESKNV